MHHPRRATTPLLVTLVAAGLALSTASCTSGADAGSTPPPTQQPATTDTSPAPSPSTTKDPKQTAIDQRTADAIARYKEFSEIQNASYQKGESAYSELSTSGFLGSHDIREDEKGFGAELEDRGYKQAGSIVLDSFNFIRYNGDPDAEDFNGHEIELTVCADLSAVDYIDSSGDSHFAEEQARRILMNVTMRGIEVTTNGDPKTVWAVARDQRTSKEC